MAWTSPSSINATEPLRFLPYLNGVTYNWFSRLLLITLWVIFFFGWIRAKGDEDWIGGLAMSSYIVTVLATMLWIIGFVSGFDLAIAIAVTLVASAILFLDRR